MKKCSCCGEEKPETDFQIRRASADGLTAACKQCLSDRDRARANRPSRVEARRSYQLTAAYESSSNAAKAKWARENRIKRKAQVAVGNAIRDSRILSQPCFVCGSTESEAHHADYDRPLDVTWLCDKHHKLLHKEHRETLRQIEKSSTRVSP